MCVISLLLHFFRILFLVLQNILVNTLIVFIFVSSFFDFETHAPFLWLFLLSFSFGILHFLFS